MSGEQRLARSALGTADDKYHIPTVVVLAKYVSNTKTVWMLLRGFLPRQAFCCAGQGVIDGFG
jgi:hypothetical protein